MDLLAHNRATWDRQARAGDRWSTPMDDVTVARAKAGEWEVILTPNRPVPRDWFGDLSGRDVLCLASGGGQQAAAGARVVSYDLSEEQLARDELVAERHGLPLECVRGDMADLSRWPDARFDLVFHPVSNVFVPCVETVWAECVRVLRPGGVLLAGFMNPCYFLVDHDDVEAGGRLEFRYRLPYSDLESLEGEALRRRIDRGDLLEFGHSLDAQIGGQLSAGFVLTGFYEDWWSDDATPLNRYMPTTMATRAVKAEETR
jgi:SAM-dependent methyltransferase